MTREEAIKIIRREYSCVDRDCDIERSCGKCPYSMSSKEPILKAYCLAVEALELVTSYEGTINKLTEALNQQRWIPVSERLPEKSMPCLVSVGKLYLTQIAIYSDLMGTIDHKIFYQGNYGYNDFENITEYVKAWMPLPESFKAESEEV